MVSCLGIPNCLSGCPCSNTQRLLVRTAWLFQISGSLNSRRYLPYSPVRTPLKNIEKDINSIMGFTVLRNNFNPPPPNIFVQKFCQKAEQSSFVECNFQHLDKQQHSAYAFSQLLAHFFILFQHLTYHLEHFLNFCHIFPFLNLHLNFTY